MAGDKTTRPGQSMSDHVSYIHTIGLEDGRVQLMSFPLIPTVTVMDPSIWWIPMSGASMCSDAGAGRHRLTRKCGTDGFMAPEIIRNQPYDQKVPWPPGRGGWWGSWGATGAVCSGTMSGGDGRPARERRSVGGVWRRR